MKHPLDPTPPGAKASCPDPLEGGWFVQLNRVRAFSLVGLLLGTSLCQGHWSQKLQSDPAHPSPGGGWVTLPADDGTNWIGYPATDGEYHLVDPQGAVTPLPVETKGHRQSALTLAASHGEPAMLWREKRTSKQLYVKKLGENASPVVDIAGDSEPLSRLVALTAPDDLLHALWYGEKTITDPPSRYNLYYRTVDLHQGTTGPLQRLVEGIYPMMAMDESGNTLVLSWVTSAPSPRMVAMLRDRNTGEFSPPVTIAPVPDMSSLYKVTYHAGRFMAFWLAMNDSSAVYQLRGYYSDDKGATWTEMALPGLEGLDLISLDVAMQGEKNLALTVSGNYRSDADKDKFRVMLAHSTDKGATWSQARSPLPAEGHGRFNAFNSKVEFGPAEGELFLVWQDWRDIRSRVYLSYSKNFGQDWVYSNLALPADAMNVGLGESGSDLWRDASNTFHLISTLSLDDKLDRFALVKNSFRVDDLAELAAGNMKITRTEEVQKLIDQNAPPKKAETDLSAIKSEEALRGRVQAFWQDMIAAEYGKTYAYYDPFYRAINNEMAYFKNLGVIKYHEASVKQIHLDGNQARVEMSVRASMPKRKMQGTGEEVEKPAKEVSFEETWLWVDDNWYREYFLKAQDIRFTRY